MIRILNADWAGGWCCVECPLPKTVLHELDVGDCLHCWVLGLRERLQPPVGSFKGFCCATPSLDCLVSCGGAGAVLHRDSVVVSCAFACGEGNLCCFPCYSISGVKWGGLRSTGSCWVSIHRWSGGQWASFRSRGWTDLSRDLLPCRLGEHRAGTSSPCAAELYYDQLGLLSLVD